MRACTQQQAADIQRGLPPVGVRLAAAQARMAYATQMLTARSQTPKVAPAVASLAPSGTGQRHTVTINHVRLTGMVNFQELLVEFDLTVLPDRMPPYPATTQQAVSQTQTWLLRPGLTLHALVGLSNPGGDPARPREPVMNAMSLSDGPAGIGRTRRRMSASAGGGAMLAARGVAAELQASEIS